MSTISSAAQLITDKNYMFGLQVRWGHFSLHTLSHFLRSVPACRTPRWTLRTRTRSVTRGSRSTKSME